MIDVHQEENHWERLQRIRLQLDNRYVHGLGIPMGSGIFYHSKHIIEAVRKPAWLFEQSEEDLKRQFVLPERFEEEKTRINQ